MRILMGNMVRDCAVSATQLSEGVKVSNVVWDGGRRFLGVDPVSKEFPLYPSEVDMFIASSGIKKCSNY